MSRRRRRIRPFANARAAWRRMRAQARRAPRPPLVLLAAAAAFTVALGLASAAYFWARAEGGPPTAVIVDQLGATDPNQRFIDDATAMLEAAGYRVEYIAPESVDVALYRDLPRRGYDFIVIRSHSSQTRTRRVPVQLPDDSGAGAQAEITEAVVSLFTNAPYAKERYTDLQRALEIGIVSYPDYPERGRYFGITPEFVQGEMRGRFGGATIVLMGCGGLHSSAMAQALVGRGAGRFISWDNLVTASHTDRATQRLLEYLIGGRDAADAAARTMADLGPDPAFGSVLAAYP